MKLRVLTALVLGPLALLIVGWAPEWLFLIILLATVERAMVEYNRLIEHAGFKTIPGAGYVAVGALCLAQVAEIQWPASHGIAFLLTLIVTVILTLVAGLFSPSETKHYLSAATTTLFGILYIGGTLSWLVPLRFADPIAGRNLILLLLLVSATEDIFAYLIGRGIGRTPLFPRISPKKTVEGSIGGLVGSLAIAWGFAHWFWQTEPLKTVILYSVVVAVAGPLGDLVESAMKRASDVKDSGTFLPGHGGLLDRIDSLILSAPALWVAVTICALFK
jgi:phosphatidate cytidylyltransferase